MKVSVLTPTRNRPDLVQIAVRSVLDQTWQDWELIVHDVSDSPVDLPDDPRVRVTRGPARGPALDFQTCLEQATGDLITPLADDDRLPWHALEAAVGLIGDHEWLCGRTAIVDDAGSVVAYRGGDEESVDRTLAGDYWLGGAIYWRRSLTDRVGGFDERYDGAADFDLYLRFLEVSRPMLTRDVLYVYRDWHGTDSRVRAGNQAAVTGRIRERLVAA